MVAPSYQFLQGASLIIHYTPLLPPYTAVKNESKIIVALEIGTTKTCMVVGEIFKDGPSTILGLGEVPSTGMRDGLIIDENEIINNVSDAWQIAQDHANVDIQSVYVSITGDHIKGQPAEGFYYLSPENNIITQENVDLVNREAATCELPPDRTFISGELGSYYVDDKKVKTSPVGLQAGKLSVQSHIIHGNTDILKIVQRCIRNVPLEVEAFVFAPVATAHFMTNSKAREAGALIIDIGSGTTDYACYCDNNLVACGCIPQGSNAINFDIIELSGSPMSLEAAESLKRNQGDAFGRSDDYKPATFKDANNYTYSMTRGKLNDIIRDRMADILQSVKAEIPAYVWERPNLAIYLSGGGSLMLGLNRLAEFIFKKRVYQPFDPASKEDYAYMSDARYCTTIGLIYYAMKRESETEEPEKTSWFKRLLGIFRKKQ